MHCGHTGEITQSCGKRYKLTIGTTLIRIALRVETNWYASACELAVDGPLPVHAISQQP